MAGIIYDWRQRVDAIAMDLSRNREFVMDRDDTKELLRLSRVYDDFRVRQEMQLRMDMSRADGEMMSIIKSLKSALAEKNRRIKMLKDDRGMLKGQVLQLEEVLESHDIKYRIEIDGERDPAIKHDFYVGDHVVVLNGLQAPASWYKQGNKNGRFINDEEALHAQVTRVTVDRVYLLNPYKVKFWRSPKHIKRLGRAKRRGNHGYV
jgi:hypothetical protein